MDGTKCGCSSSLSAREMRYAARPPKPTAANFCCQTTTRELEVCYRSARKAAQANDMISRSLVMNRSPLLLTLSIALASRSIGLEQSFAAAERANHYLLGSLASLTMSQGYPVPLNSLADRRRRRRQSSGKTASERRSSPNNNGQFGRRASATGGSANRSLARSLVCSLADTLLAVQTRPESIEEL